MKSIPLPWRYIEQHSQSLQVERRAIGYLLLFPSFGTMNPSNSIRVRKFRDQLQTSWEFRYSHSSLFTGTGSISVPPPLWWEFYLSLFSEKLCMTFDSLGSLSSHGVMTRDENSILERPGEKYLIPIPPPGVVQTQEIQAVHNTTRCVCLAGGFRCP